MDRRRVTVFLGHFGSGKTEIALNRALDLAGRGVPVTVADLDVVKPYFRTRSGRAILAGAGVELLAPEGPNIHADLPIIVPQIRSALRSGERRLILDVGGDDTGARVLGSLGDVLTAADTDVLAVLNFRRPSTPDVPSAVAMVRAIEAVGRVRVTGLVSNTHLMDETTPEVVLEGYRDAREAADRLACPVTAVTVLDGFADGLDPAELDCPLVVLRRIVRPPHDAEVHRRPTGPLFVVN